MNKAVDPIGQNLKAKRKERRLSVPELSDLIGIPADRIYKWEASKATPKYEDRQFLEKWINSEDWKNIPHETPNSRNYSERSLENLTESNKILAEANRTLADANKTLAEANHVISKNHDELIQLTKLIVSSSNRQIVSEEHHESDKTKEHHPSQGDLSLDKKYSTGKRSLKDS